MIQAIREKLSYLFREHLCITVILVLAALLRCYRLFEIPYMHDELSALVRTQYTGFHDLINLGVKHLDTHPALIQVFLFYWTKLFGYSEWIVKLPFILSGIGSVYMVYKLGTRWSNKTVGLIVASILACSEYCIMHSQTIRPYSTGLFLTLLLVYHWSELVFYKNKAVKHQIYFVLAAVLCAYNHHFSLLTSALVGVAGLFYVEKKFIGRYLLLCIISVLLYLPHIDIFVFQLSKGGVGAWLGKPEPGFLAHYLNYVFHFSGLLIALLIGIWIYGRLVGPHKTKNRRALYFSGILFFLLYFTAYFYSVYGSAVLQFSVLIFVFPFLLLFVFGWVKEQSCLINTLFAGIICIGLTATLIFSRKYYTIFYVPTFKQLLVDANDANKENPNTLTIVFSDEPKNRFYELHQGLKIPDSYVFITVPGYDDAKLENLLNSNNSVERVCLAANTSIPPTFRAIILEKFPHIIWQRNYYDASTLLAKKGKPSEKPIADITKTKNLFNGYNPGKWYDGGYHFEKDEEWGPGYSKPLSELVKRPSDIVDVVVKLKLTDLNQDPLLVINVQSNDSVLLYRDTRTSKHVINKEDSTVTLVQSVKFIDLKYQKFEKPTLNTFVWNMDKKPLKIVSFRVIYRKDNPLTYGLYEPIVN